MKKLNLIWQTHDGDQTDFEFEYTTKILFSNFDQNLVFDNKSYNTVLDNSVIIYSNNSSRVDNDFLEYLQKYVNNKYNFFLLHYSNENLGHDCGYYSLANHVFRNYYDQNITQKNVEFIPLGFKSGFYKKNQKISCEDKIYDLSFIGQPKQDRDYLLNVMEQFESKFVHKTESWNCRTSMNQDDVSEIYYKTKFVPCPMGWVHPDSFRIMESLESGSVPILKIYNNVDTYVHTLGKNPLPLVNEWHEIESLISTVDYCKLQIEVSNWYLKFKKDLSERIYEIIARY